MFGFGRKALPPLDGQLKWWVIESQRFNLASQSTFRVFDAVIAENEQAAIENLRDSDEKLGKTLMQSAIRNGKIHDESGWEPVSTLVQHLSISAVTTQAEIAKRDPELLGMLLEHEFFLDEFKDDPKMAVGGGIYDWSEA